MLIMHITFPGRISALTSTVEKQSNEVSHSGGRYYGTWSDDKKHGEFTYSKTTRREK
jgi:hypothetical protein